MKQYLSKKINSFFEAYFSLANKFKAKKKLEYPLEFAIKYGLIADANENVISRSELNNRAGMIKNHPEIHLIKDKAIKVLIGQMGDEFIDINSLPDHLKGLTAAFMAFGAGNKKAGQAMLDHMSATYKTNNDGSSNVSIVGINDAVNKRIKSNKNALIEVLNFDSANDLLDQYKSNELVLDATRFHSAFTSTRMISLLEFARKEGVLSHTEFMWLHSLNSHMYFILKQVGDHFNDLEALAPLIHCAPLLRWSPIPVVSRSADPVLLITKEIMSFVY